MPSGRKLRFYCNNKTLAIIGVIYKHAGTSVDCLEQFNQSIVKIAEKSEQWSQTMHNNRRFEHKKPAHQKILRWPPGTKPYSRIFFFFFPAVQPYHTVPTDQVPHFPNRPTSWFPTLKTFLFYMPYSMNNLLYRLLSTWWGPLGWSETAFTNTSDIIVWPMVTNDSV